MCSSVAAWRRKLVSAAQAVESGKEVERKLSSMQAEHSKVNSMLGSSQITIHECDPALR